MKQCIKLSECTYVNLKQVGYFHINDEQIVISAGGESDFTVEYFKSYPDGKLDGPYYHYVNIQDFCRIKRQICKYFKIDEPKSDLSEQSNTIPKEHRLDVSGF
ncbi:hypothetical protein [Moritella viscosa]|uniref:hypothetical protein n=1 Tax=Moritella viscosa TaxID=80854 RepID=UPI00094CEE90|nr:hypothetical protein [Moritella viscosa]